MRTLYFRPVVSFFFMAALWNRAGHYILSCGFFFPSIFFFSSHILSRRRLDVYHTATHGVALVWIRMQVWNVLHAARWKSGRKIAKTSPSARHRTSLPGHIFANKAHVDNRKKILNSNISSICNHNMVDLGPLTAEIRWRVWGTPANFNRFRVLAVLLHGTLAVSVNQTLRRWTESATYIRQGGHHVGHWPTSSFFLSSSFFPRLISEVAVSMSTILRHMMWP